MSTKTGWAYFVDGKPLKWGTLFPDKKYTDFGSYPQNYAKYSMYLISRLSEQVVKRFTPDCIVVEETNKSKSPYSQKILEFLHFNLIDLLAIQHGYKVFYVKTGEWRKTVNSRLNTEEKKLNLQIAKIKKKTGKKLAKIDGKVVGKKGKKHAAIRTVAELFEIPLKRSQEDAADALLIGAAYIKGCVVCDGIMGKKTV